MKLEVINLGKEYHPGFWALKNFNLTLSPGIVGLLGPNGAGKSTLMRILATLSRPTEGTVRWNGVDICQHADQLRSCLGYLPQDFGVYPHLNAEEFLHYLAAVKGLDYQASKRRISALLEQLNLYNARKRPIGGYSGGMRQRLGIAQALLNDPKLLIVDEPTVGLDPEERVRFRHLLTDIAGDRIIILSTHIVSDVEAVANELVIISNGCLLAKGEPEDLVTKVGGRVWEAVVPANALKEIRQRHVISSTLRQGEHIQVRIVADEKPLHNSSPSSANLEDAYLYLVNQGSRR